MTHAEIRSYRLHNQRLVGTDFTTPQEVVSWVGAMQAQEYAMAKWAIGLRTNGLSDSRVEKAFNDGEILRTHLLRPTWHFVTPTDIRWMLELTAPRVHQVNSFWYRKLNYDSAFFKKTNDILAKALEGNKHLIRTELQEALKQKSIEVEGIPLVYILMHAELEGIICSGPRIGNQFSYALLDERVAPVKKLTHDEALAKLAKCYYTSRGPASVKDFVTWSGLTMKEAKDGAASLSDDFTKEMIDGLEYIYLPNDNIDFKKRQPTFLMPDYDEYGMGYKDRSAISLPKVKTALEQAVNAGNYHMFVVEGMVAGTWKKNVKGKNFTVDTDPFLELSKTKQAALKKAEEAFIKFSTT